MKLGTLKRLAEELGVGETFACALKKASGAKGRKFNLTVAIKWLRANPGFKVQDVYPKRKGAQ